MRSRLLLGALVAASAFALPGAASADTCVPENVVGVCVNQDCFDPHCTVPQFTVYTQCEHPMSPMVCALVAVRVTVPR